MTRLLQVIYASAATERWTAAGLVHLLRVCRNNNARVGITGFLGHNDGTFLQLLEGPPESVRRLVEKIQRDPRHDSFTVLLERATPDRFFPEWSMGFQEIDQVLPGPGLSECLPQARSVEAWGSHPDIGLAFFELCRTTAPRR